MDRKLKIKPPSMPNFVSFEQPVGKREEGYIAAPGFPITDFTADEAIEYGELMKVTFLEHYNRQKSKI